MRNLPTNDPFCSTREAAELLGVALRTIQVWVENGVLPAWKTAGGHRRIARSAVDLLFSQRAMVAGPSHPPSAEPKKGRLNVLAVDDEAEIIRLYEFQIAGWALPVNLVTASNGFQGLVRLGQIEPQILILDLAMPNMDGFQMIQSLRGMPQSKNMEIIVVSGMNPSEIKRRGGLPTEIRVMRKPIQFPLLRQIVEDRCKREGISIAAPAKAGKAAAAPAKKAATAGKPAAKRAKA
ncbi:MAG: excisionase family DNA-binding protein [Proteobacteria bacterium]|nr:excisionase family DNA-binding protein [Pseudomonadota bacterium]